MRAHFLRMVAFAGVLGAPAVALAQQPQFELVARRNSAVQVTPGATFTLVATVFNRSATEARATPKVTLPTGWQVVAGNAPFALAAGASETLILSIAVPAATAAASHAVGVVVEFASGTAQEIVRDSTIVAVREHRSIRIALVAKPGYAIAGDDYTATFLVLNRGNSPAGAKLVARSSLGRAQAPDVVELDAGASREITVRVQLRDVTGSSADEILEVAAIHASDSSARSDAAARIAIVPRSGRFDGYSTVASTLRLRAVPGDGGMSPFDLTGGGALTSDGSSYISFSANGRSRGTSRFGERESYRLELRTARSRVRLGDNLYALSSLTGSGQPGFGAAVERSLGPVTAGVFGQRFRSAPHLGMEVGGFASVQSPGSGRAKMTVNLVDRSAGPFAGRVASSEVSFRPTAGILVNAEYATSGDRAAAYNTRLSGRVGPATIDGGHHRADQGFRGPQRGSSHDYVNVQAPLTQRIRMAAFASRSSTAAPTDSSLSNAFANTGISATINDRFTVELSSLDRSIGATRHVQHAVRLRSDLAFGAFSLTGDAKLGMSRDSATGATAPVRQLSLAPRLRVGRHSLAAYVGLSDIAQAPNAAGAGEVATTAGLDVATRFNATEIGISGFGTHVASTGWNSQLDLRLSQPLSAGVILSARAHLVAAALSPGSTVERNAFYLELAVPMQLPVFPRIGPGRVFGRVSDAATGRPVRDALVRVGPRLAVTDRNGRVALSGVAPGEHRVTLGDDTTRSAAVLIGATSVVVDSAKRAPARFTVAVARGAGVHTDIRRMARVRTALDSTAPDSLVDDGPLSNVLVSLIGRSDTLYQTTNAKGKLSFTDVAPGEWVIAVVPADVPANHAFDRQNYELSLAPGDVVTKAFHLVPRRRAVQILASSETQVVAPSETASAAPRR